MARYHCLPRPRKRLLKIMNFILVLSTQNRLSRSFHYGSDRIVTSPYQYTWRYCLQAAYSGLVYDFTLLACWKQKQEWQQRLSSRHHCRQNRQRFRRKLLYHLKLIEIIRQVRGNAYISWMQVWFPTHNIHYIHYIKKRSSLSVQDLYHDKNDVPYIKFFRFIE